MDFIPSKDHTADPAAAELIDILQEGESELGLDESVLYYGFPLYHDEDSLAVARVLLISHLHGVVSFGTTGASRADSAELTDAIAETDELYSHLYARLFKSKTLKKSRTSLLMGVECALFAPFLDSSSDELPEDAPPLLQSARDVSKYLEEHACDPIEPALFQDLVATVEGAKGLLRPKTRESSDPHSKASQAARTEAAISGFDLKQKQGWMAAIDGPQRIRGLAGSGKTVVLAMKAAMTHLQHPEARILYTFYTKSLYQHVRQLITRFYRQFADQDCDWDRLEVLHAWGGSAQPGVYSLACQRSGVKPLTYRDASRSGGDAFGFVCDQLIDSGEVEPYYDYAFIDEGQDYPIEFMRLCRLLTRGDRFTLAYDELQTIFQSTVPTEYEIFDDDTLVFQNDTVLHKCYRNPREVLVCAHALGFGIYGRIVQMLENREHWEDIGYQVTGGEVRGGENVEIFRPLENSLEAIEGGLGEIVVGSVHDTFGDELRAIVDGIASDLADGLRPDDLLVVCVDDRNAKPYLESLSARLERRRIPAHNLHADSFGVAEFRLEGRVTLSTVHKAKGNEAFMVYVAGVDALFARPTVRNRNMLFTAMTRAKGWVRVSGVGEEAEQFLQELAKAKAEYPYLRFRYPSESTIRELRRDISEDSAERLAVERLLDQASQKLTNKEILAYLKSRQKVSKEDMDLGSE